MRTEKFDYHLPAELIATRPPLRRSGGRMCVVEEESLRHDVVDNFVDEIRPSDLIVLNETRVRRARLICHRPSLERGAGGGRVEFLFLHPLDDTHWSALGRANRSLRVGDCFESTNLRLKVADRSADGTLTMEVQGDLEAELLNEGAMPIPPYMNRDSDADDIPRYQTVFATKLGSAAAPTAGLHLTDEILAAIQARGARLARLTLHVGVGTFRPVSADDLDDHVMHSEEIEVGEDVVAEVAATRRRGGRVIAIGTTAVRALESARDEELEGHVQCISRATNLLIQPGYQFGVVDALLTNFHQPRSTLMALVGAFIGVERLQSAYLEAVRERYRFLSYGDAMWLPTRCDNRD